MFIFIIDNLYKSEKRIFKDYHVEKKLDLYFDITKKRKSMSQTT